jgi:UPF0716 family protein affecting phage T7 exclusion
MLAFGGGGLLIASEVTDLLEQLEGNIGIGWVNLIVASLIATPIVCTAALVGDSLLAAAERRSGHRPGARILTPMLTAAAAAAAGGIIIDHLRHAVAVDSWIGLGGSLLLLLAAVAHHHLPRTASKGPPPR